MKFLQSLRDDSRELADHDEVQVAKIQQRDHLHQYYVQLTVLLLEHFREVLQVLHCDLKRFHLYRDRCVRDHYALRLHVAKLIE